MKCVFNKASAAALLCVTGWAAAPAMAAVNTDLPVRTEHYSIHYQLDEHGAAITTFDYTVRILKDASVADVRQQTIDHSTSIETADILEAETIKADGKHITVPKDNYQLEVHDGKDKQGPVFSDRSSVTVVFPDVATGDAIHLKYRITEKEPMFPGQFSVRQDFSRYAAYDDLKISLDAPASLWLQYEARQMKEVSKSVHDGRLNVAWEYKNPQPERFQSTGFSPVYDEARWPGYAISTFHNYQEIAKAYADRALPKAQPTDRVKQLAQSLTQDISSPQAQTKALYDWVARKVDYAGNCIGIGAVVPHDTDFIIENRIGDCKDHATLLQALLAARGIHATQALVNAGGEYSLPKIPVVSAVNHVINYLPDTGQFVDSTASDTPFNRVPAGVAGKPVLLVENYRDNVRIPAAPFGQEKQAMKTQIQIAANGDAKVQTQVEVDGLAAADLRAAMRDRSKTDLDEMMKHYVAKFGFAGTGSFEQDDPAPVSDTYRYQSTLDMKKVIAPGAGAFAIAPWFFNPMSITGMVNGLAPQVRDKPAVAEPGQFYCGNASSVEEYEYRFPDSMKVLSVPDDLKVDDGVLSYEASYKLEGTSLHVKRVLQDRSPSPVCDQKIAANYASFYDKVINNVRAQVLYK